MNIDTVESAFRRSSHNRRGSITALTAVLLPVLLLLSVFSLNVAYMQLTRTELKVATDAATRTAGRAMSEYQDVNEAIRLGKNTAQRNKVGGKRFLLRNRDIEFGWSQRTNNGYGRYDFSKVSTQAVQNQTAQSNAVRIWGKRDASSRSGKVDLLFKGFNEFSTFEPITSSVSTQVDRDIALIIDRSGSMGWSNENLTQYRSRQGGEWVWDPPEMETTYETYLQQKDDWEDANGRAPVPDASRWRALEVAVNAFLDVLIATDQEELVSVATFSTTARLDLELQATSDYDNIRDLMKDIGDGVSSSKKVWGSTAIGDGIDSGFPSLMNSFGRPYAAKTVLAMTDGNNNNGQNPMSVTENILDQYNATFDAVTLSDGANQTLMEDIADLGGGQHYHADDESELVEHFEEIANNLPTIITN